MSNPQLEESEKSNRQVRKNLPLLRSSLSMSIASGTASVGGFAYWLVVAHIAPTSTVGKAAALYSSILFVNYVTSLGLTVAVARYGGSRDRDPSILFNWSVVLTVASSFVGTAVYFAIVPRELRALSILTVLGSVLIFGLIVAGISIGTVLDVRLISQHRRNWVVARAIFIGLVRVPFVFIPALGHSTIGIFAVAAGAPALCGFGAWIIADLRDRHFSFPLRPLPRDTRAAVTYATVNGVGQLGVQAPFFALPVIVLLLVSARANASFYVAWSIATVIFLIVQSVGQALLVEGNRSGHLKSQTRTSLKFGVGLAAGLALVCILGSKAIPLFYGSSYTAGAKILPVLGIAAVPWAVFTVVLSVTRVRHNHRWNLFLSGLLAVAVLAPAAALVDKFGINGAAAAWLIGNLVAAIAAVWVLRRSNGSAAVDEDHSLEAPPSGPGALRARMLPATVADSGLRSELDSRGAEVAHRTSARQQYSTLSEVPVDNPTAPCDDTGPQVVIESPKRQSARSTATGGATMWLGMLVFGSSTVALLAVLSRHPHRATFSSLAALLSLAFVASLLPSGLQLRSASLVADGRPVPRMTATQGALIGGAALALSPLLGFLLHLPVAAVALVGVSLVIFIPLCAKQGAYLAQHRFRALGFNLILEGVARFTIGALAGVIFGVTGLAAGLFVGTAVALIALPNPCPHVSLQDRPRTSLIHTSLSLALLGLYVQFDVLVAPSIVARGSATAYDLAAVPSKGVYLILLAAGPLVFPFVRRHENGRTIVIRTAMVAFAVGVFFTVVLVAARPLIADILDRPKAEVLVLGLLGLAMSFGGVTGMVINAGVARGVKHPWPPLVMGIATLLLCWPFRPSAVDFSIVLLASQAVVCLLSIAICLWGRRRTVDGSATTEGALQQLESLAEAGDPLAPMQAMHELSEAERPIPKAKTVSIPITFHLPAEVCAQRAVVCGEWNGWSSDRDVMERSEDGFSLTIVLARGYTYRFRYLLDDDRWENDWNADMYVPNIYGSEDSVIDLRDPVESGPARNETEPGTAGTGAEARAHVESDQDA
jgi:O-antigen/teichoic acid export membrane protein